MGSTLHLDPATALWGSYRPADAPFAFRAAGREAAVTWQHHARAGLAELVGFQDDPTVPFDVEPVATVDRGDHLREKLVISTAAQTRMPVYLLHPQGDGPHPVALAFHGHGYGVKDVVGLWEDGEERGTPNGYHKDFAIELCRRGFLVAAPEIACFGERQADFSALAARGAPAPTSCAHAAMLAFHLGGSLVGLRVRDGRRLVDYLQTRSDCDTSRLGVMGISGGGMHAFFSTCLDERIRACVASGYFGTFQDSILAMQHCACNYVPGLHRFGEMADLAGLIAPRPMLVEAGSRDNIFPIEGVRRGVEEARAVYRVFGTSDMPQTDYFEGRHEISGRKAYDFLARVAGLGPAGSA